MTDTSSGPTRHTPLTRAMETIRDLRRRLAEQDGNRPVAIVGIGLRLPGGIQDLGGYWDALAAGRNLVRAMPEDRKGPQAAEWDGLPQRGGFLDEVFDFDAAFFGIGPREARHLDPQHRMLLEVAWEAMEDAALPADRVQGSRCGFYLGIMWQDYREWLAGPPDAYWTTGNGHNFAAGRIAYALGLTGPTLAVDTACSSSLVAVHLAVQALRRGECDTAFAAGVNLIMSPRSMRLVQETRSLSPDGLCRTFDARAGGFTRGEGCGVVVLKPLEQALRDGDRVHAVIRGTAVNQDGKSGGFTAPNVLSQAAVIERALAEAALGPSDIGYVETHGTGTALGDPIEMEALAITLGRRNGGAPLPVGAGKTNLGHLESAAGIAGLVKAVLCLQHREIPPLVHFRTLNPRIDLSGTGITVPEHLTAWPRQAGRFAGVSSFGMSGTNAHIILGAAPEPDEAENGTMQAPVGFPIAARTPEALRALAGRYADHLAALDPSGYRAFASTATTGRARLEVRAWIDAPDQAAAVVRLRELADPEQPLPGDDIRTDESGGPRLVTALPTYPWQRRRYAPEPAETAAVVPAGTAPAPLPWAHRLDWISTEPAAGGAAAGRAVPVGDMPPAGPDASAAGRVLVVAGDGPVAERIAQLAGARAVDLVQDADMPRDVAGWERFWAARPEAEQADLLLVPRTARFPDAPGEGGDLVADGAEVCAGVVAAVDALNRTRRGRATVVTCGARRVRPEDRVEAGAGGLVQGLAPVLGLEFTDAWRGVVDLPYEPGEADLAALLGHLAAADAPGAPEDLAVVRDGAMLMARLAAAPGAAQPPPVDPGATYLVTGGLGAVGRELTDALVRRGARHLLLIGRRGGADLLPEAAEFLDRLAAAGVTAVYRGGGSDTPQALEAALAALARMPPVRGVVHAAGVVRDAPASGLVAADLHGELRAKAAGAWWLHLASRDWPLDFFVLVSSVSSVWGTEGHAAYSAANGALDQIAAHRLAHGLPAVSIAFGPWDLAGAGMAGAELRDRSARLGIGALDAAAGRAALTAAAPGPDGLFIACPLDLARVRATMAVLRPRALLTGSDARTAGDTPPGAPAVPSEPSVVAELAALPERARAEAARGHVARLLALQLGHDDASELRAGAGFFDQGLDSIAAVDLAARLACTFAADVLVADVFDHPTVADLAAHLLPRAGTATPAPAAPSGATAPVARDAAPASALRTPAAVARAAVRYGPAEQTRYVAAAEPVAIVGMAGRFPQAPSAEEFWELLRDGRDGVTGPPEGRWDAAAMASDRITTLQGGYLSDIDRFDAGFFSVPAREAESLDPQQRLLLQTAWHALEDGGIGPHTLRGTRTGVFVAIGYADYARLLARRGIAHVDAYYGTGTALNAAAGRIAYTLGLGGPAMAIDTACSSSLVALHLAVRSLRSGESDAALAGGVNILLDPTSWISVSQAHMLSPSGRCRTFDAGADGFARSEGCGVLVLKRLSDAWRDGDRVLAVIRGSAVNQDGASSGLTVPNGSAQERMITAALADAATEPAEVSYLEAHGTGTSIGDPIEVGAAWRILGRDRPAGDPLLIGSVKSNIGHCETAAGMAAVFKVVLALQNDTLPPDLHFEQPNPHIPWQDVDVHVVDRLRPWPRGGRPRVASVSGFGFTGTNAHLVIADPQPSPVPADASAAGPGPQRQPHLLALSAPDADGVERLTDAWRARLESCTDDELPALVASAATGRAHLPYRRAVLGKDRAQMLAALGEHAPDRPARGHGPRIAFLFTGQGSQFHGMARELHATEPVFREVFDACDAALAPVLGASLADLVLYGADRTAVDETRITQPALVTMQTALVALWESWGVRPDVVLGHSVGEISAAICAGVTDRATGLDVIAERARLMQATERGAMLAIAAPEEQAAAWAEEAGLDLAAVNGPQAAVVSGAPDAVAALQARLKADGVRVRRLAVSHAFHSRLLDPALDDFATVLAGRAFADPAIPIVSDVTGRLAEPGLYTPDYWREHARRPVRFLDGLGQLAELDVDVCLEIGPDRTLVNLVNAAGLAPSGGVVSSLRRGSGDRTGLLTAAGVLYEAGQDLDWAAVYGGRALPDPTVPRYPFARTRHWAASGPGGDPAGSAGAGTAPGVAASALAADDGSAPAWGTPLRSPGVRGGIWRTVRTTGYPAHLTDHRLYGVVSVPGASQIATVLSALGEDRRQVELADLHFPRALVLHDGERYELQIVSEPVDGEPGAARIGVHSLVDPEHGVWQQHLAATVLPGDGGEPGAGTPHDGQSAADRADFTASAERHLSGAEFYAHLHSVGYHLGPSFRWIDDVWIRGDEALVRYARPEDPREDPASYAVHPGLLDSCLQSAVVFAVGVQGTGVPEEESALAIPFSIARVNLRERPPAATELWGHIRAARHDDRANGLMQVESADIRLFDGAGRTVLVLADFRFRRAPRALLERSLRGGVPHAYALQWQDVSVVARDAAPRPLRVAMLGAETAAGHVVVRELRAQGHEVAAGASDPGAPDVAPDTAPDLILDVRFAGEPPSGVPLADAALAAATAVAEGMRQAGPSVPYAVLAGDGGNRSVVAATLWGMLASVQAEQPEWRLPCIELTDGWQSAAVVRAVVRELRSAAPHLRVRVGAHGIQAARIAPVIASDERSARLGGAALITGGLGALGLSCARALADAGYRAITLMARSAPDARARAAIDELIAGGTTVHVVRGDVTRPADCRTAVTAAAADVPLRAVLHLAGTTADRAFDRLTDEDFRTVFAPKAAGAETLAAALAEARAESLAAAAAPAEAAALVGAETVRPGTVRIELESLVLFSSASAVLGSAGQAGYAAANGFLGGLAAQLRTGGVPATCVDWGPWVPRGGGGLADAGRARAAIARQGLRPLTDDEAGTLLGLALGGDPDRLLAVAVDDAQPTGASRAWSLLEAGTRPMAAARTSAVPAAAPRGGRLRDALLVLVPGARDEQMREHLRRMVAEIAGQDSAADDGTGFAESGLDSIMIIDLRNRLSEEIGRDLPATVALDYPTVARLAAYTLDVLFPAAGPARTPELPAAAQRRPAQRWDRSAARPDSPEYVTAEESDAAEDLAALSFDELLTAVQADVTTER